MKNYHLIDSEKIDKKEVKRFLEQHRDKPISAAKLEYSMYLEPEAVEIANQIIDRKFVRTEEDLQHEKMIASADTSEELLKLMRKPLLGFNRRALRKKVLENEAEILPLIKEKSIKIGQDIFIENALYFFLHCEANCCEWIVKEYMNFRSEYLKSMFCLVLGFRGEVELIPFLMKEAERFERKYPTESYDQGPLLAVQELAVRFLK